MEKISVIIPVYNVEDYIEQCIRSVCASTYRNIEIILVDDESTDKSGIICDKYADLDKRIRVIHKKNGGVSEARNIGIENSIGDYISFVDGDDYIEVDYIERLINAANDSEAELVIAGFVYEYEGKKKAKKITPESYNALNDEMWAYRLSAAGGRLYSKRLWDRYSIAFTTQEGVRGEDVPVCLLANYASKNVTVLDYPGYHYVQHNDSAMHRFVGMRQFGFPYEAMDELAVKCNAIEDHNSKRYWDVGILKFFAHFYYFMGRGAERTVKNEMLQYFRNYIKVNCPDYKASWKHVRNNSTLPMTIRGAINLLIMRLD